MRFFVLLMLIFALTSCEKSETIVFSSDRSGNSELYMMNTQTMETIQLTDNEFEDWAPTRYSSHEVTFLRQQSDGIYRYVMNIKTKETTSLDHPKTCTLDDKNVIYGPKSKRQLFQCDGNIYLSEVSGENEINITKSMEGQSFKASWYPDESKICFSYRLNNQTDIYAFDFNTEEFTNLTNHPKNDDTGEISPDGKKLLFSSNRDGNNNQDLYILNLESQSVINITNTPKWELIGRWSKDGKTIYFGSNKDGNWELYAYDIDTRTTKRLTENNAFDGDPRVL